MVFRPGNPIDITVQKFVDEIVQENEFHMFDIQIRRPDPLDPNSLRAKLTWTTGNNDGEVYSPKKTKQSPWLSGPVLVTKLQEQVPAGFSFFDAWKHLFWAILQLYAEELPEEDRLPPGEIS